MQNRSIKKNDILPVTILFFRKFYFILRTSYKEFIWCIDHPNVHIHTSRKRWNFVWGCPFPVSILKIFLNTFYWFVSYLWCTLKMSKFTKENAQKHIGITLCFTSNLLYFIHPNKFQIRLCAVNVEEAVTPRCFLKSFAKFIGKHLWWSLFFKKLQAFSPKIFLKRDSVCLVFLWVLQNSLEHLFYRFNEIS